MKFFIFREHFHELRNLPGVSLCFFDILDAKENGVTILPAEYIKERFCLPVGFERQLKIGGDDAIAGRSIGICPATILLWLERNPRSGVDLNEQLSVARFSGQSPVRKAKPEGYSSPSLLEQNSNGSNRTEQSWHLS